MALLDQVAVAQHHDAVGHLRHHGEVVGDVDGGGVELAHHVLDRRQHLDLGGHVERRGRLVEDDQIGPARHGHGGHRALKLAARDLVGIAEADIVGIGQPQAPVEVLGIVLGLAPGLYAVLHRHFSVLVDQLVRRVERRRRALRHIGDTRAAQLAPLLLRARPEVDFVEQDRAAGNAAAGPREAHAGDADGRLAGARFADQTQHLAAPQHDVDAVHDLVPHVVGLALDTKPLHFEQDLAQLMLFHVIAHRAARS